MASAVAIGPHSLPSVSSSTARLAPRASASRSWSAASGGPRVSTETVAPSGDLDRLLDGAFLVRADGEPGEPGVHFLLVRGQHDLAADHGNALDAGADLHTAQLRTRLFSGSNSGVDPATATVTGYCSP